jgi:hypothetical protein
MINPAVNQWDKPIPLYIKHPDSRAPKLWLLGDIRGAGISSLQEDAAQV